MRKSLYGCARCSMCAWYMQAPAPSWTDRGPGKTRYGGSLTDSGFQRATRFVLSELALEVGATLPWGVSALAQINVAAGRRGQLSPLVDRGHRAQGMG